MQKLNTLLAFCIRECVTIDQSPIRKNTKALWIALKRRIMNFGAIIGVYWRYNKVISTAENVLILYSLRAGQLDLFIFSIGLVENFH